MTVTGPSGSEIHTERERPKSKLAFAGTAAPRTTTGSSTWVRPMQPALSGGFFLPRTGWEVLVGFDSDPVSTGDTPIELGRLIHAARRLPPSPCPLKRCVRAGAAESTPGGGKQNQPSLR
jgi:type VI secretion system secreted protein VgrG